jgi:hypothetical protein
MTTYNRGVYFARTLESLERCGEDLCSFLIYDDCSTESFDARGHRVIRGAENIGVYMSCIAAISAGFMLEPLSDWCVYTQDDVLFSRCFITHGIEFAELARSEGHNIGIFSLFQRAKKCHDCPYIIMHSGHPGAICWLVRRDFWKVFLEIGVEKPCTFAPNDERKRHFIRNLADYKICRFAQINGFAIAYPRRSLTQHIGDVSSITHNDMSFCASENFVGEENEYGLDEARK